MFALGFQHFPRDFANVNEWKIIFHPSTVISMFGECGADCLAIEYLHGISSSFLDMLCYLIVAHHRPSI